MPREPGTPVAVTSDDPGRGPRGGARVFLLLSTSDTDLLSARASGAAYRLANPARTGVDDLPALLDGVDLVVVRILGGRRAWEEGSTRCSPGRSRWWCSAASRPRTPS